MAPETGLQTEYMFTLPGNRYLTLEEEMLKTCVVIKRSKNPSFTWLRNVKRDSNILNNHIVEYMFHISPYLHVWFAAFDFNLERSCER